MTSATSPLTDTAPRAAERRAEAAKARATLAAGAAERHANHERTRHRITEERRRRDADLAERAARDATLVRVRATAEAAREALRRRFANSRRRSSSWRDWEPLSDDEWVVLSPFIFRHNGSGRPVRDPRGRLDAIFWPAARPQRHLPPWRALAPEFGKPDIAARQFRRWAAAGLWIRLLQALADPDQPGIQILRRLAPWICRTYRRAWAPPRRGRRRARPPPALLLRPARPLRFPARPAFVRTRQNRLRAVQQCLRERGFEAARAMMPRPDFLRAANKLLWAAGGGRRINRCMAPW